MNKYLPGLCYVLSMSIGLVLLDNVTQHISPILSLLITSVFAIVFFHLATKTKFKHIYHVCRQYRYLWLIINIIVCIIWVCSYYSVKWIGPTALLFLFFLAMTSAHWARELLVKKSFNINIINIILPIIFIVIFCIFNHPKGAILKGIIPGVIAGVAGSYYNSYSKTFAKNGQLTANDVLAVRFYAILLLTPFFLKSADFININLMDIGKLMLISLMTFILPLYMSQRSLMQLTLGQHTAIITLTPLGAYVVQGLATGHWSVLLLSMSTIAVVFLLGSEYRARLSNK